LSKVHSAKKYESDKQVANEDDELENCSQHENKIFKCGSDQSDNDEGREDVNKEKDDVNDYVVWILGNEMQVTKTWLPQQRMIWMKMGME
jgi:hypothetical protein